MSGQFYEGTCPVGGEKVSPKDRLSFRDTPEGRELAKAPYVTCPLHGCRIPVLVVAEEDHAKTWRAWDEG